MRKTTFIFPFFLIIISSCSVSSVEEILNADREFSDRSLEVGMKKAFLEFADDTAVILQAYAMPIHGKHAIMKSYQAFSDEGFVLTWEPIAGDISSSGDLGYTYGLYTMKVKADSSERRGKYVTIWKKQADGSWKFVLDGGNEGLQ